MKMTDIMKKSHSESKSENLDAILQKIDNKAFITNSADSAHTETKPQPIKLRRKSVGIAALRNSRMRSDSYGNQTSFIIFHAIVAKRILSRSEA